MSVGIVRVQKFGKGSVKGVEIHDQREKEGISHTNPDIDWGRSHENYDLCPAQNRNYYQAVKERIEQLHLPRAVRKDAVVMAQVLVTSDREFFDGLTPEQTQKFFRDAYSFLADRYGTENIVSAMVHMDERTPHMHVNFVPVTPDGKLSAKRLLTRQALIEQQTAFQNAVGVHYGLRRGMTKEERVEQGVERKHMATAEYKAYTKQLELLQQEVEETHGEAMQLRWEVTQAKNDLQEHQESLRGVKNRLAVETAMITGMEAAEPVKPVREHGGRFRKETVEVSKEDFERSQQAISALPGAYEALQAARNLLDVQKHKKEKDALQGRLRALQSEIQTLRSQNQQLKYQLSRKDHQLDEYVDELNALCGRFSDYLQENDPTLTEEKADDIVRELVEGQSRHHGYEMSL